MDDYRLVSIMHVPIVEARNVSKSFSGVQALQDVSLTLRRARFAALGENGSGEVNSIKVIAGVVTPDNGDLVLGGNRKTHGRLTYPQESSHIRLLAVS